MKTVLLVIDSIPELSSSTMQLINSCDKEMTDPKTLLKRDSELRIADMKINCNVITWFEQPKSYFSTEKITDGTKKVITKKPVFIFRRRRFLDLPLSVVRDLIWVRFVMPSFQTET